MIIKSIEIEKFRAFKDVSFSLGKRITAISGRNATLKTTVLGMIGQPFTISARDNPMYGCKTIDGYNFHSQFKDKFKFSPTHDKCGEHIWKLNLHKNIHENDSFTIKSIERKQRGRPTTLRFWNVKGRSKGCGYIQLPVYFLSLSRLFPIGETGKTHTVQPELTPEELDYTINNYRTILSIQKVEGTASVGIEKGTSSKTFSGVSDGVHDIFTNSAGEGNITRIILAVLSFKRLKEQYEKQYKGGILLIDELDATLYGFSQSKLVEYLYKAANDYNIQIIFTTHSPIILKAVNKLQKKEYLCKGMDKPVYAYDNAIVYLEPINKEGKRVIMAKNVKTSSELNQVLNDINLTFSNSNNKINIYCEDILASSFLQYVLKNNLTVNLDLYMNFIDINLGWTNYVQLAEKNIPEFRNNVIILDGDVPQDPRYEKKEINIKGFKNFLFLPLVIEKDLFVLLKNNDTYDKFQKFSPIAGKIIYDVCFNNWPLECEKYSTSDFKNWYKQIVSYLGNQEILFSFWCEENKNKIDLFVNDFINTFNDLAKDNDADILPQNQKLSESDENSQLN